MDIRVELTKTPKAKPTDESNLGFGHVFTDHMFIMNYDKGQGWHDARIVPYAPLELSPAAMCLHYAQEVFEGLKAYRTADGSVQLFRPEENFKRLNVSNERLVIPQIDVDFCIEALDKLVSIEKDWVPHTDGAKCDGQSGYCTFVDSGKYRYADYRFEKLKFQHQALYR